MTEQWAWKELEWQPFFLLMRGCSCQVKLYAALWQLSAYWHAAVRSKTCSCQLPEMQLSGHWHAAVSSLTCSCQITDMQLSAMHWHAAVSSLTCSCQLNDMQMSAPWNAAARSTICSCAAHDNKLSPWTLSSCQHKHYWADNASAMQLITQEQLTKGTMRSRLRHVILRSNPRYIIILKLPAHTVTFGQVKQERV